MKRLRYLNIRIPTDQVTNICMRLISVLQQNSPAMARAVVITKYPQSMKKKSKFRMKLHVIPLCS